MTPQKLRNTKENVNETKGRRRNKNEIVIRSRKWKYALQGKSNLQYMIAVVLKQKKLQLLQKKKIHMTILSNSLKV